MRHPTSRDDVATRPKLDERDVARLKLIASGATNERIAEVTGVPTSTTGRHLSVLFEKLGARDRTHAVVIALGAKLFTFDDLALPTWVTVERHAVAEALRVVG